MPMFSPVSLARDLNSDSRDRIVRVTLVLEIHTVISLQCGSTGQSLMHEVGGQESNFSDNTVASSASRLKTHNPRATGTQGPWQ